MINKPLILIAQRAGAPSGIAASIFEEGGYRAMPVRSGAQAIAMACSHCPDLIFLDLDLPDMNALEVLRSIRGWSAAPVIAVCAAYGDADIVRALDSGADDCVPTQASPQVLLARTRAALRRAALGAASANTGRSFVVGGLSVDFERRLVKLENDPVHLTPIEYRILSLLAANPGKVLPYRHIRREIWGPHAADNRVLRVNMANLRKKLEKDSANPQYIHTETGVGYRMAEGAAQ